MVYNELAGLGAYQALAKRGLVVPRDVTIIGYDDVTAHIATPAVSIISLELTEVGPLPVNLPCSSPPIQAWCGSWLGRSGIFPPASSPGRAAAQRHHRMRNINQCRQRCQYRKKIMDDAVTASALRMGIFNACLCVVTTFMATLVDGQAADVAAGSTPAQLGSAIFYPSPEHPVGDMGDGTGRYPGVSKPCLEWQEHAALPGPDRNILWETRLRGWSQSHPIVVGNKLITLEEPNFVVCLDAASGKLLWRTECDHLTLWPQEEQQKARTLIKKLTDLFFKEQTLHWEHVWLTGTAGDGKSIGPYFPMPRRACTRWHLR